MFAFGQDYKAVLGGTFSELSNASNRNSSSTASRSQIAASVGFETFYPVGRPKINNALLASVTDSCGEMLKKHRKSKESILEAAAHVVVQNVLGLLPYPLFLIDKKDVGEAGNTKKGPVPDAFVFPSDATWGKGVDRQHWWARAALLVEYKKVNVDLDTGDCLGQCIQYGQELLRACPMRAHGVVVLFNFESVRIVVVSHKSSGTRVQASTAVKTDTLVAFEHLLAAVHLAHLSSTLPLALARSLDMEVMEMVGDDACYAGSLMVDVVGSGATARVFKAADKCVKIFKPDRSSGKGEFDNEVSALKKLEVLRNSLTDENVKLVKLALPELIYSSEKEEQEAGHPLVIVTNPLGIPLDMFNVGDLRFARFIPAVQALQLVHANNLFHRDLGPQNWVVTDQGGLVMIDWGFSVEVKDRKKVEYCGSKWYAADSVLKKLGKVWHSDVPSTAAADLESLVKTVVSFAAHGVRTYIKQCQTLSARKFTPEDVWEVWQKIWKHKYAAFALHMLQAAKDEKYDLLINELSRLDTLEEDTADAEKLAVEASLESARLQKQAKMD
jgi:hypothetical protein